MTIRSRKSVLPLSVTNSRSLHSPCLAAVQLVCAVFPVDLVPPVPKVLPVQPVPKVDVVSKVFQVLLVPRVHKVSRVRLASVVRRVQQVCPFVASLV